MSLHRIMNDKSYTPKQLSELLNVTPETLKQWEIQGKIKATKTKGGHRRYFYANIIDTINQRTEEPKKQFIYARVSSTKQKNDLERQVAALKEAYPSFDVIQDVGSGINFRRRGFISLLDNVLGGNVSQIVVSHRDRLTRFGFELFQMLFTRFGVTLTVLSDSDIEEPITELAKDLLSIVTVFTARYYGSRKYQVHPKNKVLSNRTSSSVSKPMLRGVKVLLQQSRRHTQQRRTPKHVVSCQA